MATTSQRDYYEGYWRQREGWGTGLPRRLQELFERYVSPDDRCLDVGCGDGGTSGDWLSANATAYVGVDISERAVQHAVARGLNAQLIDDAAELPFPDASFDLAVCVEVLEHLFEPHRAVAEIRRVLRPGGRLIVTVPNLPHWRSRIDIALLGRWNPRGDPLLGVQPWRDPHIRFFSLGSLVSMVEQSEFHILERGGYVERGFLQFVPRLRHIVRTPEAHLRTRWLAARFPRLLAETLYVTGRAAPRGDR